MQNHGVVAYGQTLTEAYLHMETVEHCACVSAVIKLLGQKTTLNAAQAIDLLQRRRMRYDAAISAVSA
jgi:L-fuculose-phosphate aldolase